jgi:DNA repair exonuclease SbcCD ATPase subunit
MTRTLSVPVAPGELLDKISILEIKIERIDDPDKRHNVEREHDLLIGLWHASARETAEITRLRTELKTINEQLWEIEDEIRDCERRREFGDRFVELARAVYRTNDRRAAIKRQINEQLGSAIIEEKSYAAYD